MSEDLPPSRNSLVKPSWWSRLFRARGEEVAVREDVADFLVRCRRRNLLAPEEHAMLQGVLNVSETRVRDIMVPRSHMVVLELDDPPKKLRDTIIESGHSRFPVIGEDRDQVIGILLAKDFLKHVVESHVDEVFDIEKLLRPAVFIPESKRLDALLTQFRESHNHMAIVVDEYAGVAGLATIEDVLEQIVGDIDDEHDAEEVQSINDNGGGRFTVLALTRIEEFNDYFHTSFLDNEYDTLGGLIMHELGRLPRRGEALEFSGFLFRTLRADRRRVHSVEVTRIPAVDID
ncbi:MAG: magnesium/cobalt efflux protein [Rhodospirillaceae bacterium]|nr:magnesium/cobalt efflux protein [Rhodospirillaceae bacterium]|tara:strand:- start:789 stop:1655 length:867 start_codon:yes stop_codon:yes gene_type:complete